MDDDISVVTKQSLELVLSKMKDLGHDVEDAIRVVYKLGYVTCRTEALHAAIHMSKAGSIAAIRELEP